MKATRNVALLAIVLTLVSPSALASDAELLTGMLHDFLANADKVEAHERFWAEDLVYSSSMGLRFGKADIMSGFDDAEDGDAQPAVVYSGEDVDVRLYGEAAVVAFKLVGTPSDGSEVLTYFNTGTFVKRNGSWKVVAWQATRIPPATD